MRALLSCLVALSCVGCSLIVDPHPRQLFVDTGIDPMMGDAGPNAPDAYVTPGEDAGPTFPDAYASCGSFEVGNTYTVITDTCGFVAVNATILTLSCPSHTTTVRLDIVCNHMHQTVPLASDPMPIDCDGGTFVCHTVLSSTGVLSVECAYAGGNTCGLTF